MIWPLKAQKTAMRNTRSPNYSKDVNILLTLVEKIDLEQVLHYNGFVWALALHIKGLCTTRIQCRDSKI